MSASDPSGFPVNWEYAEDYASTLNGWYTTLVAAVLASYDLLICLDEEINLVWSRRFNLGTVLYALNRIGMLITGWGSSMPLLNLGLSLGTCYNWSLFNVWALPLQLIFIELTLLSRVIAMYSNIKVTIPLVVLFCLSAACSLGVTGVTMEGASPGPPLPPALPCYVSGDFTIYWASWLPPVVNETVLFILTVVKTLPVAWSSRMRTPVVTVLLRDGTGYFAVIFALMLSNVLLYSLGPLPVQDLLALPMIAVSSMLCSRLALNLRRTVYEPRGVPQTSAYTSPAYIEFDFLKRGKESRDAGSKGTRTPQYRDEEV